MIIVEVVNIVEDMVRAFMAPLMADAAFSFNFVGENRPMHLAYPAKANLREEYKRKVRRLILVSRFLLPRTTTLLTPNRNTFEYSVDQNTRMCERLIISETTK